MLAWLWNTLCDCRSNVLLNDQILVVEASFTKSYCRGATVTKKKFLLIVEEGDYNDLTSLWKWRLFDITSTLS